MNTKEKTTVRRLSNIWKVAAPLSGDFGIITDGNLIPKDGLAYLKDMFVKINTFLMSEVQGGVRK